MYSPPPLTLHFNHCQHSMPYACIWMYPFLLLMLKLNVHSIARPITNWCVADSLSEESVKELCSAAWNGDLYRFKRLWLFISLLQVCNVVNWMKYCWWWWRVVISITGIFGNILTSRGNFAVLKREFPVALIQLCSLHYCCQHKDGTRRNGGRIRIQNNNNNNNNNYI